MTRAITAETYATIRERLEPFAQSDSAKLGEHRAIEIAAETGVAMASVYRALSILRVYHGLSKRDRAFRAIVDHGPLADPVAVASAMERRNGESPHEITHVIWDLQKLGYITFKERKVGDHNISGVPTDIRLQRSIATMFGRVQPKESVEAVDAAALLAGAVFMAVPDADAKGFDDPVQVNEEQGLTIIEGTAIPVVRYPALSALFKRSTKMALAVRLLREAGKDDVADLAEEDMYDDDLQKEIAQYLYETGFNPDERK